MPKARHQQVCLSDTPYYHCISRCVRRAYLFGDDNVTGKNYDHRKQWIVDRLAELTNIFAIDVFAYSLMDNHIHSVLNIKTSIAKNWTEQEVIQRWQLLFTLPERKVRKVRKGVKSEKRGQVSYCTIYFIVQIFIHF